MSISTEEKIIGKKVGVGDVWAEDSLYFHVWGGKECISVLFRIGKVV